MNKRPFGVSLISQTTTLHETIPAAWVIVCGLRLRFGYKSRHLRNTSDDFWCIIIMPSWFHRTTRWKTRSYGKRIRWQRDIFSAYEAALYRMEGKIFEMFRSAVKDKCNRLTNNVWSFLLNRMEKLVQTIVLVKWIVSFPPWARTRILCTANRQRYR